MQTRQSRGFTLVELMVTLAIFAVLVGVAAPSFNAIMVGPRLGSFANALSASATLARSEAIKRNTSVTLCASADGAACAASGDWEQGWIVLAGTTVVERQQALTANYRAQDTLAGSRSLSFQSSGAGSTQAAIKFCQATPAPGMQEKVVSISATGRTSVATTRTGSCP
ncbi:GspH/FimT family pseudopilin [Lacisediminimonas sp.]|uniref:GspH/FimT family pseudopilin n=1 Tax=Lacisediminimonas sp. TaxID=3060582 RepID=UPI002719665F|nr:GspH/FimT family pseudopilin [Lacisediminimonas sp.]MDO8298340.1 GspH/FimT family pseudopilin [Lacisediminimonas sp.]